MARWVASAAVLGVLVLLAAIQFPPVGAVALVVFLVLLAPVLEFVCRGRHRRRNHRL